MAKQIKILKTYNHAHLSAFKLAVKALAAVYAAPPDTKATTLRGMIECASKMIGRFGMDPVSLRTVDVPPPRRKRDELSEYFDIE